MKKSRVNRVLAAFVCVALLSYCMGCGEKNTTESAGRNETFASNASEQNTIVKPGGSATSVSDDNVAAGVMDFSEISTGNYVGRKDDFSGASSWFPLMGQNGDSGVHFYIYSKDGTVLIDSIDIKPELVTNADADSVTVSGTSDSRIFSYELTFYRGGTCDASAKDLSTGKVITDTFHVDGGSNNNAAGGSNTSDGSNVESPLASYKGVTFDITGHGYDGTKLTISLGEGETIFDLHYVYSVDSVDFSDVIHVKNEDIHDLGALYEITESTSDMGVEYALMFGKDGIKLTSIMLSGQYDGTDIYFEEALQ